MSQRTRSGDALFVVDVGSGELKRVSPADGGGSFIGVAVSGDSLYLLLRPAEEEIASAREASSEVPVPLLKASVRGEVLASSTVYFRNNAVGLGMDSFGFCPIAANSQHLVVVEHFPGDTPRPNGSVGARFHSVSLNSMRDSVPVTIEPKDGNRRGFTVFMDNQYAYFKEVTYAEGDFFVYSDDLAKLVAGPLRFSEGTDATSFVVISGQVYIADGLNVKRIMDMGVRDEV